ncbi:hypothetical protein ACGFY9_40415 [Streptomyces sp. NPDC048504]|uniref:hypothetical protein n=1 Tax=Streptomyces sp. NPDC048504 TaxID=3365559 RepID=UPI00371BE110
MPTRPASDSNTDKIRRQSGLRAAAVMPVSRRGTVEPGTALPVGSVTIEGGAAGTSGTVTRASTDR